MLGKAESKKEKKEEYVRRHNEIWQKMKEALKEAGISNYSIWYINDELFGYHECEKGVAYAAQMQANSSIGAKRDAYMKDILIMDRDPVTGAQPLLEQIFYPE